MASSATAAVVVAVGGVAVVVDAVGVVAVVGGVAVVGVAVVGVAVVVAVVVAAAGRPESQHVSTMGFGLWLLLAARQQPKQLIR